MKKYCLFFVLLCATAISLQAQKKNVLVIHSYHKGLEWTDDITRGIENCFRESGESVDLAFEYLDTKKYGEGKAYFNEIAGLYALKYKNKVSVIIISDNAALNFIKDYRDKIAPGTPVVFCGINDYKDEMIRGFEDVTGIAENVDYYGNISLIRKLHPGIDSIIVINDNKSMTSVIHKKLFSEMVKNNFRDMTFVYWEDVLISEIDERASRLSPRTAVFLLNFHVDKANEFIDYPELAFKSSHHGKAPVYAPFTFFFGKGIVGGLLTSGLSQGRAAATLALRILRGEDAAAITVIKDLPSDYMFDYEKIRQFNIDINALPPGSTFINFDSAAPAFSAARKDYALLFGCDKYDDPRWKTLNNPVKDVTAIAYELETRYGFITEVVENPVLDTVAVKIRQYARKSYGPEDQLLIYFSGHGYFDDGEKEGYIVLRNSVYGDISNSSYYGYAKLTSQLGKFACNHIFLILDNCYSGTVFKDIAMAPPSKSGIPASSIIDQSEVKDYDRIREVLRYKTRKALTAGGKVEVSDGVIHSPLTLRLLEAFRTSGGKNQVLTTDEIRRYCEDQYPYPKLGDFSETAEPGSDFLFITK